ncbi:retrovirus-related pol polyprotein from transposon TNT 1-94 [Tanacetum coccineum]
MSTPEYIYPIIILSDSDVEDTFSSTHSPDYIPALSDYSLASPGNTSPNFSDDLTKDLLSSLYISPFHDDLRNVTASKTQTLEEATNIAQRLMDQILKHNSVQEANDRKRSFEDRRNIINSNNYANNSYNSDYPNNLNNKNHPNNHNDNRNHDHHPQQNGRQETLRTYAVSPTKYTRPPKKYLGIPSLCIQVISTTSVSRPQLKSNRLEDRVMHNNSEGKKQQVEDHRRNFKFSNNKTFVTACNDSLNAKTSNVNFVCVTCGKCVLNDNHDMCVLHYINGVNSRTKMPMAVPISTREPKRTVNQSAATPLKRTVAAESTNQKPRSTIRKQYEQISKTCKWWYCKITPPGYKWEPKSKARNVNTKVRNDLLTGSRGTDLYSITLQDITSPNPICLMAKASSSQAWLWHHRLSYMNFDTINLLLKNDIVIGLPKLKFVKDHLCFSCELGKAKRKPFETKTTPCSKRQLQLPHMDLCGLMRVENINGKKYVLVTIDDYSRYTLTYFLRSKDETPEVLIDFLRLV